ncbi:MAG: type II toxin-antitoxin system VapC family toxin [Steroidobacteraceae bacterium]
MLVDTSVWADHLRRGSQPLIRLLEAEQVMTHPFVVGELACGNLARRAEILDMFANLPTLPMADHSEVLHLLETHRLFGTGLGWIDLHLLASVRLADTAFWTHDKRLAAAAKALRIPSL